MQSSVGRGAGTGVRGNGGEECRHGGVIGKFFHISMHRLLIEDLRCMLKKSSGQNDRHEESPFQFIRSLL